jgi:hypothetical protein
MITMWGNEGVKMAIRGARIKKKDSEQNKKLKTSTARRHEGLAAATQTLRLFRAIASDATREAEEGLAEAKQAKGDHLRSGDILVEPEDVSHSPHDDEGDTFHITLHDGQHILHSTTSNSGRGGIKQHQWRETANALPGLVFRPKSAKLCASLSRIGQVFALSPSDRTERNLSGYLTPYASPYRRTRRDDEHERHFGSAYAFARAMRTLAKARLGGKQSLSRQGLSCSQFGLYTLQAATLDSNQAQILCRLDKRARDFVSRMQTIIDERLTGAGEEKLHSFLTANRDEVEHLNEQLQSLQTDLPELAILQHSPKGMDADWLVEIIQEDLAHCIESVTFVPSISDDGKLDHRVLGDDDAKAIPARWYSDYREAITDEERRELRLKNSDVDDHSHSGPGR